MAVARVYRVPGGNALTGYAALSAVADLLTIPRNSPQIYENALGKVLELMDLRHGNLRLLNPATGSLDLMAHRGFPPGYVEKFRTIKIGERSSGKVVRTRAPVLWDNIQTDPFCSYLYLRKEGVNSLAGVPLLAREGVIGSLVVASLKRGRFREPDIQLLSAMGRVVGVAIENNRLFMALESNVDDLTRLTLRLEESDGVKHRLLSVMSHELRTPISIILGNVELLMDGTFGRVNEQQRDSLLTVRRSGTGLLFHVENALDVSLLEGGGVPVYPDPFTIHQVRDSLMELLGDEIAQKQLEMHWEIDPNVPPLFTDRGKITKVFRNLLDNAIKFTENGGVTVKVSFLPEAQRLQCVVEDTGIGIPPAQFQVIFDPFHQIDSSHTRLYGGMGLGLRSVKKTLELLGGGIEVESMVGKGSLFRFWFPIRWGAQQ
ncbi:MAG: GAF domain-containing protein [Deltaproteobacteria bacterium]|nr:GAF domain-containing protein [Deltaproteobacteria bacterium]